MIDLSILWLRFSALFVKCKHFLYGDNSWRSIHPIKCHTCCIHLTFCLFSFFYFLLQYCIFCTLIGNLFRLHLGTLRPAFYLNMTYPYIRFYSKIIMSINLAFSSRKKISSEICLQDKCTISSHDELKTTFSIEISSLTQYRYVSVFECRYWSLLSCKST